ncbi:DUF3908 family protein [Virgibacillus sp. FSP13]
MSLDYREVSNNLYQVKFADAIGKDLLNEYLHYTKKPKFVENHKIFYPKGIFTDEGLNSYYFFTETKIARISFLETIDTQIWKFSRISTYKLSMTDSYNLKLEIQFDNGDVLLFDSKNDTNSHRQVTLKKKIESIYNLIDEL